MSRRRTREYIDNLKKKKPKAYDKLKRYAEQVKPPLSDAIPPAEEQKVIGDNTTPHKEPDP
jgi:hypothetical protein